MKMSSLLYAELAATCNALGYYDGTKYHKDVHCIETIKDIIRYLRRDDDSHEIRRYLGDGNILKTDLLPILKDYSDDKYLFEVLLRLLVNLTNPVLVLFREELPEEKTTRNYYLKMICHLQSYKEAFVDEKVWTILGKKLGEILQVEWQERDEDMNFTILRILTLARNVLQVPADRISEKRPDSDASLHDQILWAIHVSGLVDIFLYIACSDNEDQYYMHILEIVSQMLREQNPSQLAIDVAQRSVAEQMRDESELMAIRERESEARREKMRKFASARHSRFLGTYCVKNVPSISDRDLIYHRPLNKLESLDLDRNKKRVKLPKNRMPLKEENPERRSAFSIRLFLKKFCVEFLNGAYNNLMYRVKGMITGGETQANDETYYLWTLKFFMEFNRCYKFRVELVSETISLQTFHFVQTQIENYFEMMKVDKKKIPIWSRRLHLAIKAYQELLMTLGAMSNSPDRKIKDSAQVLMSNIFYVVEYRELCLTLLISYVPQNMSTACLQDLIKTVHVFMKLLEAHCCSNRTVLVQKKSLKRRKGKKAKITPGQQNTVNAEDREKKLEEEWEEIGPQLSAVLQSGFEIPGDVVPFDATLDVSIEDQRADAMRKIQDLLRQHKTEEAVGLLRAAREVWPENDYFGNSLMAPEDEFMAFREIFFADIKKPESATANEDAEPSEEPNEQEENEANRSEDEEEDEGQSHHTSMAEQSFQFKDFLKRFANMRVIQPCALILRDFKTNAPKVNHCALRLMHRIAVECSLPALFFQASLFRTFQKILEEYRYAASRRSSSTSNEGEREKTVKELAKFAVFIVRKFIAAAKNNPKLFMELLFWKNARDAYDVEFGYGSYQEKTASAKAVWSEEQEDEIRRLCEEFIARGVPETNLVEEVHNNIIDKSRSKKAVAKKMKELGLITANVPRKLAKPSKVWAEEEISHLTSLYQELKDAFDPVGMIIDRLQVKRPKKRIIEKILELGLASDRSELYKKRKQGESGKRRNKSQPHGHESNSSSDGSTSSDESSTSEEERDHIDMNTNKATHKGKMPRRMNSSRSDFSSKEVISAIKKAVDLGFSNALEWLMESLEEAAEDEGEESVPLLPISEDAMIAMEDANFLSVLKEIGIVEPNEEQEIYWRIPANYKPRNLRAHAQAIDFILKNKDNEVPAADGPSPKNEMDIAFSSLMSDSSAVVTNGIEPKKSQKKQHRKHSSSSSGEEDLENFFQTVRKENTELEVNEMEGTVFQSTSLWKTTSGESSQTLTQRKKKQLILHDDSSSDDEILTMRKNLNAENFSNMDGSSSVVLNTNGESPSPLKLRKDSLYRKSQKKKLLSQEDDDSTSDDEKYVTEIRSQERMIDNSFTRNGSNALNDIISNSNTKKRILTLTDSSSDDETLKQQQLSSSVKAQSSSFEPTEKTSSHKQMKRKKLCVLDDESSSSGEEIIKTNQEFNSGKEYDPVNSLPILSSLKRKAIISDDEDE